MTARLAPLALALALGSGTALADEAGALKVGDPAPAFELTDLNGNTVSSSDFDGKILVIEWFNPGCPFVKYAHGEGPLASMAKNTVDDDIAWVAINSGAPGKQGHGLDTNRDAASTWNIDHPILIDESGAVGKAYGAITTPQIYIRDKKGKIAYMGALDNAPLGKNKAERKGDTTNYVEQALGELQAGQRVSTPKTKPYGCSVKY